MAEMPSGIQATSGTASSRAGDQTDTASLDSGQTSLEAYAASPTEAERLLGAEQAALEAVMASIRGSTAFRPELLPDDSGLVIERLGLLNRMTQLEEARQQLLAEFDNGNVVCTAHSNYTVPGLEAYITDYNRLANSVSTYNAIVNVGTTIELMHALPYQVMGTMILGSTAIRSGYNFIAMNPSSVTFADDFLSTIVPGTTPAPSMVGYGTAIGATIAEALAKGETTQEIFDRLTSD